jgi:hypothetical protein
VKHTTLTWCIEKGDSGTPAFSVTINKSQAKHFKTRGFALKSLLLCADNYVLPYHINELVVIPQSSSNSKTRSSFKRLQFHFRILFMLKVFMTKYIIFSLSESEVV